MAIKISKNTKIQLRIENSQKLFLNYASYLSNQKLSTFIINSALKEASDLISNQIQFKLSNKKWKDFCIALDKPADNIPKLKKLLKH